MENLTIEQAFSNVQSAIEMFKGTKQEHIILEQSLYKLKQALSKSPSTLFDAKVEEVESN